MTCYLQMYAGSAVNIEAPFVLTIFNFHSLSHLTFNIYNLKFLPNISRTGITIPVSDKEADHDLVGAPAGCI